MEWFANFNRHFNLAEYLPEGIISIRSLYNNSNGENIPIYISGRDYQVICGNCQQIAFRKQPVLIQQTTTMIFGTNSNFGTN